MPVSMGEMGPGWGCSCRAFRMGEPTPEQAFAALARSANVTVVDMGASRDNTHRFGAWTDPESQYVVTYDPNKPGGWDKHILACLTYWVPWFRQVALGACDALDKIKYLEKENKKLQKLLDKKAK